MVWHINFSHIFFLDVGQRHVVTMASNPGWVEVNGHFGKVNLNQQIISKRRIIGEVLDERSTNSSEPSTNYRQITLKNQGSRTKDQDPRTKVQESRGKEAIKVKCNYFLKVLPDEIGCPRVKDYFSRNREIQICCFRSYEKHEVGEKWVHVVQK